MFTTNLPDMKREYEILGLVEGESVYSKHLGKDFMASFKNMVGGELKSYTEMLEDAKKQALERMEKKGMNLGADAILNASYNITNLQQGSALVVIVTGTAIRFI